MQSATLARSKAERKARREMKELRKKLPRRATINKLEEQARDLLILVQDVVMDYDSCDNYSHAEDIEDAVKEIKKTLIRTDKLARKIVARTVAAIVS